MIGETPFLRPVVSGERFYASYPADVVVKVSGVSRAKREKPNWLRLAEFKNAKKGQKIDVFV
ncbi:hypothetical protein HOD96_01410 [Candidatus Falkowbacteria bacterium]|jgi:hypothetical protein|nr:hypothetical protein [Candidatus Falkowbacteria bacterium]MBT4432872.1 hypothetical protein [Candidatus Falkowbacteria bacterium]